MELRCACSVASAILVLLSLAQTNANAELVVIKADRKVDLSSHNVRSITNLKVENTGFDSVSEVLFALPSSLASNLAFIGASAYEGKVKNRATPVNLPVKLTKSEAILSEGVVLFSIILIKPLKASESTLVDVYTVFTHLLKPFPEEITQSDVQLVLYYDSVYVLSPYPVKVQTTSFKLPSNPRIESYTKVNPVKLADAEIKYGPYENIPAFSSLSVTVHYENNQPFAVVEELVREIEISNWGNIYVTENYQLTHGGAKHKGGFSRLDFQARPGISGRASLRGLQARLPPRAHSVYYRDEIGNVSTSHLRLDKDKTELLFEPRYPLLGGWHVTFTIGYGVPLQDFVFRAADGKRYLRFPFGCPIQDVVVKKLVVKVVLPEGSKEPSVQVPFTVEESNEVKYSYLDSVGRTVVVLTKKNVVQEHNVFFEIYFKFNPVAMLVEPLMLVTGFFLFFIACVAYARLDFSISKSSASYQARIQREELIDAVQKLRIIFVFRRANVSDKLEASLKELARTGDIQGCKAARKAADAVLRESTKDLNAKFQSLQCSPRPFNIVPKVEALVAKEKEKQEKLQQKHTVVVESFERKLSSQEIDNRIAPYQQRISVLKQEIDDLLQSLDDF
ncbi:hypothetical protein GOP47_0015275 [Adiantum capillus-veneris]|uniref:Dolichyl-diphosphooligosaccharide--protein glycosyltransferase subunit 1 n=1 Tax=Adiantum capillus-veneris TaxID=13818 RepID=A0A9D4UJD9_ADICA|nr:hypothetical protein GOP47_0015275 [Adiantum capillus-veneris]